MNTVSITDFNTLLKTHIHQHEHLADQLIHIQHLIDFTANSDLKAPNPLQLNAQLLAIETLLKEAQALQASLQADLIHYVKETAEQSIETT